MKICFLGPFWTQDVADFFRPEDAATLAELPGMGGFSLTALVRLRLSRQMPTEVVTLDPSATSIKEFSSGVFKYTICPRRTRGLSRSLFNQELKALGTALEKSDADLFHANWAYEYSLAALRLNRPTLVTVRDHAWSVLKQLGWGYLPNYLVARHVMRRAQFLSAVSPYNAKYVEKVSGKPVDVVPNCASPKCLQLGEQLAAETVPFARGLTIASAISSVPYKNPKTALHAFSRLKKKYPRARYQLMGPGLDAAGPIAHWSRQENLADGVDFMGNRSHAEAISVFSESDVILHPSLEEACSSTLLEAMALGKPILAGKESGGCPWVLDEGNAGALVDVRSASEIADTLARMYEDRDWTRTLAQNAFRRARTFFSPEAVSEGYNRIYERILEQKSR